MTNPANDPISTVRIHPEDDPTDPHAVRRIRVDNPSEPRYVWDLLTFNPDKPHDHPADHPDPIDAHDVADWPVQRLDEVARVLGHPNTDPELEAVGDAYATGLAIGRTPLLREHGPAFEKLLHAKDFLDEDDALTVLAVFEDWLNGAAPVPVNDLAWYCKCGNPKNESVTHSPHGCNHRCTVNPVTEPVPVCEGAEHPAITIPPKRVAELGNWLAVLLQDQGICNPDEHKPAIEEIALRILQHGLPPWTGAR